MSRSWPRIDVGKTLAQKVYEAVRDRIIHGELEPRRFLREDDVAQAMGVSRTPVREALARLASEGFIDRIPHRGFRVPELSIEDLVHRHEVLLGLEVFAGRLAFPRLDEAKLSELERANERFAAALARRDVQGGIDANDRFHHLLSEASGNPVLCGLLDDLRAQVRRLEVWDFSRALEEGGVGTREVRGGGEAEAQHAAMLEAVRGGDFERAAAVLEENRSSTYRAIQRERRERRGGEPGEARSGAEAVGRAERVAGSGAGRSEGA